MTVCVCVFVCLCVYKVVPKINTDPSPCSCMALLAATARSFMMV